MTWRKKLFDIIETESRSFSSKTYDICMLFFIIISLVPLAFREQYELFYWFDYISVSVFIVDYLLRWLTADYKLPNRPKWQAFLLYPFTVFAIIDLLSILPSFLVMNKALKMFRITRLAKILRVFKFIRYSKNVQILFRVLRRESRILLTVFWLAVVYIFMTALIMFNVEESDMFADFFDALYWATTTLTTVGYGDICPTTDVGRVISMLSAIMGVAVIALPSGVITASYLDELREMKEKESAEAKARAKSKKEQK